MRTAQNFYPWRLETRAWTFMAHRARAAIHVESWSKHTQHLYVATPLYTHKHATCHTYVCSTCGAWCGYIFLVFTLVEC